MNRPRDPRRPPPTDNLNDSPLPRLEDPLPSLPDVPTGSVIDEDEIEEVTRAVPEPVPPPLPPKGETPYGGNVDGTVEQPQPESKPSRPQRAPAKIKRYRSSQPINSGGMGEIFLVRDQRLNRDIAAKVLNPRMSVDPRARERFTREVNVISTLQHPGIVTVYDCGLCHDGRPFYMMQYIDGRTFDEVIREYHSTRETKENRTERSVQFRKMLNMVIDVCNAVSYMHSQGYLHRDLKPANVMVGSYGETILIDMGLAKHFEDRREEHTSGTLTDLGPELTRDGAILGTPEYMSPEQASGSIHELRETSDIYSLGAMLYKVLTGSLAIHPSANYHVTLAYVLEGKFDAPRKINPTVPHDLEAIVLKAMAMDPQDRYQSAKEMSDDLRLWLADEPVSARKPSLIERTRRWAKRKSTLVASLGILVLSTLALLLIGLVVVNRQKDATELARQEALRARAKTRESLDTLLVTLLDGSYLQSQKEVLPEQRTLLTNLLETYQQFAEETPGDIEGLRSVAQAAYRLAFIQRLLGELKLAEATFEKAIADYRRLTENPATIFEDRTHLARSMHYYAATLSERGKTLEATNQIEEAIRLRSTLVAEQPNRRELKLELARSFNNLGILQRLLRKFDEAKQTLQKSLEIERELLREASDSFEYQQDLARTTLNLGDLYLAERQYLDAETTYRDSLEQYRQLGVQHPSSREIREGSARSLAALADLFFEDKRYLDSIEMYQRGLDQIVPVVTEFPRRPTARELKARLLRGRGIASRLVADFPAAEADLSAAVKEYENLLAALPDSDHRDALAWTHFQLGLTRVQSSNRDGAETEYRKAIEIASALVEQFPDKRLFRSNLSDMVGQLGLLLQNRGNRDESDRLLQQQVDLLRTLVRDDPQPNIQVKLYMGLNSRKERLMASAKWDEAMQINREQWEMIQPLQQTHPDDAEIQVRFLATIADEGRILQGGGKPVEAEAKFRDAVRRSEPLSARFPKSAEVGGEWIRDRSLLAQLLTSNPARQKEAEELYRLLYRTCFDLAEYQSNPVDRHLQGFRFHREVAHLLSLQERDADTDPWYREGLNRLKDLLKTAASKERYRLELAGMLNNHGVLLIHRLKDFERGIDSYQQALLQYENLRADAPKKIEYLEEIARTQNNLGLAYRDLPKPNWAEAISHFQVAAELRKEIASLRGKNRSILLDRSGSLVNLAECRMQDQRIAEARATWIELVNWWEDAGKDAESRVSCANAYQKLAVFHNSQFDHPRARKAVEKEVAIWEDLVSRGLKDQFNERENLAFALELLAGECLCIPPSPSEAERHAQRALLLQRTLAEANPKTALFSRYAEVRLRSLLGRINSSFHPRRSTEQVLDQFNRAVTLAEQLRTENPDDLSTAIALANAQIALLDFYYLNKMSVEAAALHRASMTTFEGQLKAMKNPPELLARLGQMETIRLRDDCYTSPSREKILASVKEGQELRKRLETAVDSTTADTSEIRRVLPFLLDVLGLLEMLAGNGNEAVEAYDRAILYSDSEELRLTFKLLRITALIQNGGDRTKLKQEAEILNQRTLEKKSPQYSWCVVLSLLAEAASKDPTLTPEQRREQVDDLTRECLKELKFLAGERLFDDLRSLDHLLTLSLFEFVRNNSEFRDFADRLQKAPWPMK